MRLIDILPDTGLAFAVLGKLSCSEDAPSDYGNEPATSAIIDAAAKVRDSCGDLVEQVGTAGEMGERYSILQVALDCLVRTEVDVSALSRINELQLGGGTFDVWFESQLSLALGLAWDGLDTGGESELYDVASFAGLQACSGLEFINCHSYFKRFPEVELLLQLPTLKEVWTDGAEVDAASAQRLESAGIELTGHRLVALDPVAEELQRLARSDLPAVDAARSMVEAQLVGFDNSLIFENVVAVAAHSGHETDLVATWVTHEGGRGESHQQDWVEVVRYQGTIRVHRGALLSRAKSAQIVVTIEVDRPGTRARATFAGPFENSKSREFPVNDISELREWLNRAYGHLVIEEARRRRRGRGKRRG